MFLSFIRNVASKTMRCLGRGDALFSSVLILQTFKRGISTHFSMIRLSNRGTFLPNYPLPVIHTAFPQVELLSHHCVV